ncbi:MAG TPA: DUF3047 domain-containing protein [Malonomonas sp.]
MKTTLSLTYIALLITLLFCVNGVSAQEKLLVDDFENGLSSSWSTKSFEGKTIYTIVNDAGGRVLQAVSNSSASGLIFARKIDLTKHPILSWRWKIENIIEQGDARNKSTDDYAARIYITFPHWYYPKTTSLNYIWANQLPKGENIPSPFTENSRMFAVESGADMVGHWMHIQRNMVEDYRQAFGKEPPRTAILSIMSDTENTRSKARAWYDDIFLLSE